MNVCGTGCGLSRQGTLKLGIMTGCEVDRECEDCCRSSGGFEVCMWKADLNALVSGDTAFGEFNKVSALQDGVKLGDDCIWLLALTFSIPLAIQDPLEATVSDSACSPCCI